MHSLRSILCRADIERTERAETDMDAWTTGGLDEQLQRNADAVDAMLRGRLIAHWWQQQTGAVTLVPVGYDRRVLCVDNNTPRFCDTPSASGAAFMVAHVRPGGVLLCVVARQTVMHLVRRGDSVGLVHPLSGNDSDSDPDRLWTPLAADDGDRMVFIRNEWILAANPSTGALRIVSMAADPDAASARGNSQTVYEFRFVAAVVSSA